MLRAFVNPTRLEKLRVNGEAHALCHGLSVICSGELKSL